MPNRKKSYISRKLPLVTRRTVLTLSVRVPPIMASLPCDLGAAEIRCYARRRGRRNRIWLPSGRRRGQPRRRSRMRPAAGRRLPVDHLPGDENPRAPDQHEIGVDRAPFDAAGTRDRAGDRRRGDEAKLTMLDAMSESLGALRQGAGFAQERNGDRGEPGALAQQSRNGLPWLALEPRCERGLGDIRLEVDGEVRGALGRDRVAQAGRQRIDRAALDARARHHRFTPRPHAAGAQRDVLERRAGEAVADPRRPFDDEAAIGGFQRRNLDSRGPERLDPAAVGAEPRPGAAAEREHRGARLDDFLTGSAGKPQRVAVAEADEARARNELDPELAETPEPRAQERRRLEALREHAPARAYEGLFTQLRGPGAQRLGREGLDRRPQPAGGGAVAGQKPIERLGMGEVQSAATGKQELARRARARVVDDHPPPRPRDLFRRHQPCRAGADDEAGTRFVPRHALRLPRDNAGSYHTRRFRRPPDEPDALRPGRPTRGAVVQADMACARER